jgi:hypothetical protein
MEGAPGAGQAVKAKIPRRFGGTPCAFAELSQTATVIANASRTPFSGTLRALSCHVFAPFALIFCARVHAQVGESQLELLVLHCDARPWPCQ